LFDFQYGENGLQQEAGESLYGASADMKRTTSSFDQGLYGAGEFAYSATSSITAIATIATDNVMDNTNKVSSASATYGGILNFDTEFSASYAGLFGSDTVGAQQEVFTLQVSQSMFDGFNLVNCGNKAAFVTAPVAAAAPLAAPVLIS
jgi:hypothetical protein